MGPAFLSPELLVFFVGHGIGFGLVDPAVYMIGGSIDGIELHGHRACIQDIVIGAGRHQESRTIFQRVFFAIDDGFPLSSFETEELVHMMDFGADVFSGKEGHEDDLAVLCRV